MKQLDEILNTALTWELSDMTLSNRKNNGEIQKIKVRPVVIKDQLVVQAAQYTNCLLYTSRVIDEPELNEREKLLELADSVKSDPTIFDEKEYFFEH